MEGESTLRRSRAERLGMAIYVLTVSVLLFVCVLCASDAEASRKADYFAEQAAAYGLADVVPVRWLSDRAMRREYGIADTATLYGHTSCAVRWSRAGSWYAVCDITLNRASKSAERGGWQDTIRHELCHVVAMGGALAAVGPVPEAEMQTRVAQLTAHEGELFRNCAARHNVFTRGG